FVFFFQAEDGIRDDLVTGVQTCALPISRKKITPLSCAGRMNCLQASCKACLRIAVPELRNSSVAWRSNDAPATESLLNFHFCSRSEERRVGKECASRRMLLQDT